MGCGCVDNVGASPFSSIASNYAITNRARSVAIVLVISIWSAIHVPMTARDRELKTDVLRSSDRSRGSHVKSCAAERLGGRFHHQCGPVFSRLAAQRRCRGGLMKLFNRDLMKICPLLCRRPRYCCRWDQIAGSKWCGSHGPPAEDVRGQGTGRIYAPERGGGDWVASTCRQSPHWTLLRAGAAALQRRNGWLPGLPRRVRL